MVNVRTICMITVSAAAIGLAAPLSAQEDISRPAPSNVNEELPGEIIVTARKRNETLSDVPLAITAFSGETLFERQISDLDDLARATPGFFFESQGAQRNDRSISTLVVRGMPAGSTQNATGERASVFIDGAPVFGGFVQGLTDVERVEVLRGPQSAYFGRATFSGAINLVTRDPGNKFRGRVEASFGEDDYTDNQVMIEGPLFPGVLTARVAGRLYSVDGQFTNTADRDESFGARSTKSISGTLYFTPGNRLSVKVFGTYWRDDDGPDARGLLRRMDFNCNPRTPSGPNSYICGELPRLAPSRLGQNTDISDDFADEVIFNRNDRFDTVFDETIKEEYGLGRNAYHVNLVANYETGLGFDVSYVGSVDRNRYTVINDSDSTDSRDVPNALSAVNPDVKPFSDFALRADVALKGSHHEVRLASTGDARLSWLVGGTLFDGSRDGAVFGLAPFGYAQFLVNESDVETKGVFGSLSFDVTDQLNLSVEGRYQVDDISQSSRRSAPFMETFKSFTPRAIVSYEPTEELLFYASYAKGVNPGGFNAALFALPEAAREEIRAQSGAGPIVEEEEIQNYEVGFKGQLFDRRLSISLAAYIADWSNQQLSSTVFFTDPSTGGINGIIVTTNIGETRLWGGEIEASLFVNDNISLSGSFSLNQNELEEYLCVPCQTSVTGVADVSGNKLARTPRETATFGIDLVDEINSEWDYFARADYSYRGEMFVTESNIAVVPTSHIVNARLGVTRQDLRLEAFVTNLLDEDAYSIAQLNRDLTRGGNAFPVGLQEKRRFGVRVSIDF